MESRRRINRRELTLVGIARDRSDSRNPKVEGQHRVASFLDEGNEEGTEAAVDIYAEKGGISDLSRSHEAKWTRSLRRPRSCFSARSERAEMSSIAPSGKLGAEPTCANVKGERRGQ